MDDLVVSSEYLAELSTQMRTWQSDELEPAIAAVPADWTAAGISLTAIGGAVAVGGVAAGIAFGQKLNTKFEGLMAKEFSLKKFSFTGQEAYNVAQMANAGYTIYLQISSGDYWGASLTVIGLLPGIIEIRNIRSGFAKTIEAAGAVTKILEYTAYGLQGVDLCFGPAMVLGNVSAGLGIDGDAGEVFTVGATRFSEAGEELQKLLPDSQWIGTAATAYAEDVKELQTLMHDMAAADNQMATILQTEADQLQLTHDLFGSASTAISVAIPAALALYTIPVTGPEMSQALQIGVSFAATVTTIVAMANQLNLSYHNGKKMDAESERYRAAKKMADTLYVSLTHPAPSANTQSTSATAPSSTVLAGAAESPVAQPSTSVSGPGGAVIASEVPPPPAESESGGSAGVAAAGVVGGVTVASGGGSGQGSDTVSTGRRLPRHAAPDRPGEKEATDESGAAEARHGPGAQPGAGVAGTERAPVDAGMAAPVEQREGSSFDAL